MECVVSATTVTVGIGGAYPRSRNRPDPANIGCSGHHARHGGYRPRRLARRPRCSLERGDRVRATVRPDSRLDNLVGLDVEQMPCDVLDRRQVRRVMHGVDRVFHVAGRTSLRASAEASFEVNVEGTRIVMRGGAARRRRACRPHVVVRGDRPGAARIHRRRDAEVRRRRPRRALRQRQARGRGASSWSSSTPGLPAVIVNPAHVMGRGDLYRSSTEIVRRFLRREIPAYVDGALCLVDAEDVARGHLLAEEQGTVGRALHPRQPQLHAGPPLLRARPNQRRGAARGEAAAHRGPRRRAPPWERCPAGPALTPRPSCGPPRCGGPTGRRRPSTSSATDPGHHEDSLSGRSQWYREREPLRSCRAPAPVSRSRCARPASPCARPSAPSGSSHRERRRSTAAAPRPTGCARAAGWRASCARRGRRWRRSASRGAGGTASRSGRSAARTAYRSPSSTGTPICDSRRIVEHLCERRAEQPRRTR